MTPIDPGFRFCSLRLAKPVLRPALLLAVSLALHVIGLQLALGPVRMKTPAVVAPPIAMVSLTMFTPASLPSETKALAPPELPVLPVQKNVKQKKHVKPKLPAPKIAIRTQPPASSSEPVSESALPTQQQTISSDTEQLSANTETVNEVTSLESGDVDHTELAEQPAASTVGEKHGPSLPDPSLSQRIIDLPPSATLSYEVRYSTRGNITHGTGIIDWQAGSGGYTVQGKVSKFGFALSSFKSQGSIDDSGIVPMLYLEKNARRAETLTRFQRDAPQSIFFSANNGEAPLETGAQDRASILWQLAAVARSGNNTLVPGVQFQVLVAGVKDAEQWQIDVIGEEIIELETGSTRAWHLVRAPRANTRDKRIDIWLAPNRQWYPVKLRYTEATGDYLDFSLAGVR